MKSFVFPYAGASSYSLSIFKKFIHDEINFIEYPGRGIKAKLPFAPNINFLVDDIYQDLHDKLSAPYYFWGHSMGTLISYLVIKKIQSKSLRLPSHLFVSGRSGPSFSSNEIRSDMLKEEFWNKIKILGGCPDEIFEDDEIMDYFEPILRADVKIMEQYQYEHTQPFDVPITILIGKDDVIDYDTVMLWQKETIRPVEINYFTGGHFFIFDHAKKISDLMIEKTGNKLGNHL